MRGTLFHVWGVGGAHGVEGCVERRMARGGRVEGA